MKIYTSEKDVADLICKKITDSETKKGHCVIAIPGGRSVKGLFEQFKVHEEIDWKNVHFFMVDERLVPVDHEDSNFLLAKNLFLDELILQGKISEKNLHPFMFDQKKEDFGAMKYHDELKKFGGKFDIAILGVGEDGHVAALFPNTTILRKDESFFVFHDSPKPPKDRMTSSRKLIEKSDMKVILFIGEGKRDAYSKFKDDSVSKENLPVKYFKDIILTNLE